MSSAKPKVINASVFCSTKSFISLAREKVKFEVIKLFSSSDVPMVLPFTYYVPLCLQSRLGSRYKTIKPFLNKWGTVIGFKSPKILIYNKYGHIPKYSCFVKKELIRIKQRII